MEKKWELDKHNLRNVEAKNKNQNAWCRQIHEVKA